ncbi:MAG: gliding motility-associated C-terminal domain-containing protein [Bacteroidota bacterium]|nr:gliding motility-associated C-terminal domain-containing protein [Bacteroidota bacterium]
MKHPGGVEHFPRVERLLRCMLFSFFLMILGSAPLYAQNTAGNLVVPVVFHIISQNPAATTDQQIMDAVADLNNAFAHTGPYTAGTAGVNTGIRFCLAKIDPEGGNTTGITRTQSVLGDFDSDLENDKLKNLVSWNTREYCNIWCVDGVKNEYLTKFSCGTWSRRHDIGSGTFDSSADYRDGIVTKEFGSSLASLMGSYLGLKYTFTQGCTNNNCHTDGDGVCDTPPASGPASSCTAAQNSCSSDTLSGFTRDMPDLTANFMSLSGDCASSFTAGQAAKMRSNLNAARNALVSGNKCNAPCAENIIAGFTRDNWLPKTGDPINFKAVSTGGTNYQWSVNGVVVGSNSPTYSMPSAPPGKTKVSLKVYNANASCYASYSDFIIANCGVMARFYPDVRQIASKESIMEDSILFTNRSVNATSYHWWMSNDKGMSPQIVSTAFNLNYKFKVPGSYAVWLIATNGSCSDTTEKFSFPVYDPTVDGTVSLNNVQCYQQTKINATISICNYGYAPVPTGTPVSFYDADPRNGNAHKLSTVFYTKAPIAGRCCNSFTTTINVNEPGLNQLYAVFNDNGNSIPLTLPNTKLPEANYANNVDSQANFQFHVTVFPDSATLQPGDSLQLSAEASNGLVSSYVWSSSQDLNCTQCANPYFIAEYKVYDITKKLVATSSNACTDSSFTALHIPSADDYQISIDSLDCAGADSLHASFTICNNFIRGRIPLGLTVSFYDADPTEATAHLLGPVFSTPTANAARCASYEGFFKRSGTGKVFAAVNDNAGGSTGSADSVFQEARFDNNKDTLSITPFTVTISPSDTTVSRLTSFTLNPQISGGQPRSFKWEPLQYLSCSDCSSPVVTPAATTQYQLTVQNAYACAATGTANIKTFSGGRVNIPNGFTPNNDGRNDVFYILGSEDVKMLKDFSIFNRWGQKVFQVTNAEANDPQFGWNGLLNGKPADTGTYVYFVTIAFTDGSTQLFKGTVVLIR